jgi:tryptophan synthase alpha subunit
MKKIFHVPVCAGFGVKTRKDFLAASSADIVVAGSVFVEAIQGAKRSSLEKKVAITLRKLYKTT